MIGIVYDRCEEVGMCIVHLAYVDKDGGFHAVVLRWRCVTTGTQGGEYWVSTLFLL